MKTLALALLLALAAPAFANSACDKPQNDFDGLYCLNKVYAEADRELNESYASLVRMVDAEGRAKLKASQLDWIRNRNASCSRKEGTEFFVNLECATSRTVERVDVLRGRIRECRSAGCRNGML